MTPVLNTPLTEDNRIPSLPWIHIICNYYIHSKRWHWQAYRIILWLADSRHENKSMHLQSWWPFDSRKKLAKSVFIALFDCKYLNLYCSLANIKMCTSHNLHFFYVTLTPSEKLTFKINIKKLWPRKSSSGSKSSAFVMAPLDVIYHNLQTAFFTFCDCSHRLQYFTLKSR